jgi:hypothetical protein
LRSQHLAREVKVFGDYPTISSVSPSAQLSATFRKQETHVIVRCALHGVSADGQLPH